jgi:hypothetical protein
LALVRLLSTIKDTRSATPCPNSAVSTPAATFNVVDETSVDAIEAPEVINCAAPALPSFEVLDIEESVPPPCACLSAAPALAEVEIACAMDAAVAALTAVLEADACAADAIATAGEAFGPPTPGGAAPVSGAAKPSAMNEGSEGAPAPCVMAAAMSVCAAAPVSAEAGPPLGVVLRAAVLPSVDGAEAAAAGAVLPAVPSTGLAVSAEFPAAAPTRACGGPAADCLCRSEPRRQRRVPQFPASACWPPAKRRLSADRSQPA